MDNPNFDRNNPLNPPNPRATNYRYFYACANSDGHFRRECTVPYRLPVRSGRESKIAFEFLLPWGLMKSIAAAFNQKDRTVTANSSKENSRERPTLEIGQVPIQMKSEFNVGDGYQRKYGQTRRGYRVRSSNII